MGTRGPTFAMESADITLVRGDLLGPSFARARPLEPGRAVGENIRQNLLLRVRLQHAGGVAHPPPGSSIRHFGILLSPEIRRRRG